MATPFVPYRPGTITVTNGSQAFTGSGTSFSSYDVGDTLFIDGNAMRIETIASNTAGTFALVYPGTTGGGKVYDWMPAADVTRALTLYASFQRLLIGGNLAALAALDGTGGDKFPRFTGAGTMDLRTEAQVLADIGAAAAASAVPTGGAKAQLLVKQSATNYDASWAAAPIVNVADHGIPGNTSSDKTTAIQALQDAFGTNGGVLFFPPGNYPVSDLRLKNKVNGFNGTMLVGAGQGTALVPFGTPDRLLRVEGARCAVKDMTINGDNNALRCVRMETLWDGQPTKFDNVAFISAAEHGIYNYDGDALIVRNCYFLSNGDWSIYSRNNMMNSTISGNFIQGTGIGLGSATQQCEGLRIIDNTILATNGTGVDIVYGLEIQIANNIIDQCNGSAIIARNNSSYVKILDNWLAGTSLQVESTVKFLGTVSSVIVSRNTFEGGQESQIHAAAASMGDMQAFIIAENIMRNMVANYTNIYMTNVTKSGVFLNNITHSGTGESVYSTGEKCRVSNNCLSKAAVVSGTGSSESGNFGY